MRLDIAISADCRNVFQQIISYVESLDFTIIKNAEEKITWRLMIRQVIGKSANGLTELIGVRGLYCPFYSVILQIKEHGLYLVC